MTHILELYLEAKQQGLREEDGQQAQHGSCQPVGCPTSSCFCWPTHNTLGGFLP